MHPVTQGITIAVGSALSLYLARLFWKKILVPAGEVVGNLPKLMEGIDSIRTRVEENSRKIVAFASDLTAIKSEVQANSGKSLKDQVHETKRQTEAMSDSLVLMEARQRGLIGSIARATFEADFAFAWTDGNVSVERLTGYGFTHLERRKWLSFVHDEDRNIVNQEIVSALADGREVQVAFRFFQNGGNMVRLRMTATPAFSKVKRDVVLCWTGTLFREDEDVERRTSERRI